MNQTDNDLQPRAPASITHIGEASDTDVAELLQNLRYGYSAYMTFSPVSEKNAVDMLERYAAMCRVIAQDAP